MQHFNSASHFQSISKLPHSRHFFCSLLSSNTLIPGSKGPARSRRNASSNCFLSHSFCVIFAGFSSRPSLTCSALLNGSSSSVRNPPFVSVILLKSYSTNLAKLRAGLIELSGPVPALFASRNVAGVSEAVRVEYVRLTPFVGPAARSASRCSRRALAFTRLISWRWC
jgi:hypothetical protein